MEREPRSSTIPNGLIEMPAVLFVTSRDYIKELFAFLYIKKGFFEGRCYLPVHTTYPSVAPASAFAYMAAKFQIPDIEADQSYHRLSELHTACCRKPSTRLNHIIVSFSCSLSCSWFRNTGLPRANNQWAMGGFWPRGLPSPSDPGFLPKRVQ